MVDVTKNNFKELYPQIIDDLHSSTFIAIDCEFSGLYDDEDKCSLFDSPRIRFQKLQRNLENFIIIQFGLSTFKYDRTNNCFSVSSYNFYLKPVTVLGNQKFMCHMGSIEFLCKHKFNYNSLFYDGIYYLNNCDELEAVRLIQEGGLINETNQEQIQKYCSRLAEWSRNMSLGSEMVLDVSEENDIFIYLLHQEIRRRFNSCWTILDDTKELKVKKISKTERTSLELNKDEELLLQKKLLDSVLGFSKIIKEIKNLNKPIVGHNILLDLIMIYKQFYNPSPVPYRVFKRAMHSIFPCIYDTKTISFKLKEILPKESSWNTNFLPDLYEYLSKGKGANLVICTPLVNHKNKNYVADGQYHDAGFDSFCTGFCFLKMAHIFSLWDEQNKKFKLTFMPTNSTWLLAAVSETKNQVNISRGQVNHIVMDGDDPKSTRPGLLCIQSKTSQPIDITRITDAIAKFASVDIQLINKHKALMAVANKKQAKEVLAQFKNNKDISVTKYSFLQHTELGRTIISGTFITSIIIIGIVISIGWRRN